MAINNLAKSVLNLGLNKVLGICLDIEKLNNLEPPKADQMLLEQTNKYERTQEH